jgi:hypothetical protein
MNEFYKNLNPDNELCKQLGLQKPTGKLAGIQYKKL